MFSSKFINTLQRGKAWWRPHLRRLLMMGLSGLALFFVTTAQADDFAKLDKAVPFSFIEELAPRFDFEDNGCLPSAPISRSTRAA